MRSHTIESPHATLVLEHLHHHQLLLLLLEPIRVGVRRSHGCAAVHHAAGTHSAVPAKRHLLHLGGEQIFVVFIDRTAAVAMRLRGKAGDLEGAAGRSGVGDAGTGGGADTTGTEVSEERSAVVAVGLHGDCDESGSKTDGGRLGCNECREDRGDVGNQV
jgi:hypothetical protein